MPTVLRIGPYRFFFYSGDREEPRHVHVERESNRGKFWLDPVALSRNEGFRPHDLNQVRALIVIHRQRITEAWHDHCGDG